MACNSSSEASTSTSLQGLTEEVSITRFVSEQQLQHNPNPSTVSTSFTHPDPSESKAGPSSVEELPQAFGLLAIARELRDIIYSYLISSGNFAILRVSQQVHDEAKETLYEQGTFRMSLKCTSRILKGEIIEVGNIWRPPVVATHKEIQNFNILMDVPTYWPNPRYRIVLGEDDKLILKTIQSCRNSRDFQLTLIFEKVDQMCLPEGILEFIHTLNKFKVVTLRAHITAPYHPMDRRNATKVQPHHLKALHSFATSLSSSLGTPQWKSDTQSRSRYGMPLSRWHLSPFSNAPHLVFHPRERRQSPEGIIGGQNFAKA